MINRFKRKEIFNLFLIAVFAVISFFIISTALAEPVLVIPKEGADYIFWTPGTWCQALADDYNSQRGPLDPISSCAIATTDWGEDGSGECRSVIVACIDKIAKWGDAWSPDGPISCPAEFDSIGQPWVNEKSGQKCAIITPEDKIRNGDTAYCDYMSGNCQPVSCGQTYNLNDSGKQNGNVCFTPKQTQLDGEPLNDCKDIEKYNDFSIAISTISTSEPLLVYKQTKECCSDIVKKEETAPAKFGRIGEDLCCKDGEICCQLEVKLGRLATILGPAAGVALDSVKQKLEKLQSKPKFCAHQKREGGFRWTNNSAEYPDLKIGGSCDGKWRNSDENIDMILAKIKEAGIVLSEEQMKIATDLRRALAKFRLAPCSSSSAYYDSDEINKFQGKVAGVSTEGDIDFVKIVSDPTGCSFDIFSSGASLETKIYAKNNYLFIDMPDQPSMAYYLIDMQNYSREDKELTKFLISDSVYTASKIAWYWNSSQFVKFSNYENGFVGMLLLDNLKQKGLNMSACNSAAVPARFQSFLNSNASSRGCSLIYYGDTNNNRIYDSQDVNCFLNKMSGGLAGTACSVDPRLIDLNGDSTITVNDLVAELRLVADSSYLYKYYYGLDYLNSDGYSDNFYACLNGIDPLTGWNIFDPAIVDPPLPLVCGDGICHYQEGAKCVKDCGPAYSYCGDGIKDGAEFCDDGMNNGQPGKCNMDCTGIVPIIIFSDGGFETGTGNWTNLYGVSTVAKDTSTFKTGTASLKWIDTDTGLNNTASYRNFDNLEAIKGKTINVSFWYKIPILNPENSAPLLVRIDRNGSGGGLADLVSKRYPVSEWTYISQNIKIPADATYVRLQINKGNWYTTATVNLDDVKIQLVNATCGNGIVETGEACDNGLLNGQPGKCNKYCSGIEPTRTYVEAENSERLSDASVFSFSGAYGQAIKYNSTYNIYGFAQILWPVDSTKTYNIWTRQYRPSGSDRRLCLYKSDHSYCYSWKQTWLLNTWEWVYQGKHKLSDFATTGGGNRIIVKGNGSGSDLYLDQILFVDGDDFDPQYPR